MCIESKSGLTALHFSRRIISPRRYAVRPLTDIGSNTASSLWISHKLTVISAWWSRAMIVSLRDQRRTYIGRTNLVSAHTYRRSCTHATSSLSAFLHQIQEDLISAPRCCPLLSSRIVHWRSRSEHVRLLVSKCTYSFCSHFLHRRSMRSQYTCWLLDWEHSC